MVIGLCGPNDVEAADFSREEAAVRAHVAERLGIPLSDVEVLALGLVQPLDCGPEGTVSANSRTTENFVGHADIRLVGIDGSGECGSARIRSSVKVWMNVPVAKEATLAGSVVPLEPSRVAIDQIHGVPVSMGSGPWEARVSLAPGSPVTLNMVRPVPDAKNGSTVTLESGGGALRVTAQGRLLENGQIGERVKVSNLATNQIVYGILVEPDRVRAGGEG